MKRNVVKVLDVPTGHILIVEGERGPLECVSLGDYGPHVNLNQHKKVVHGPLMPLTKKWVWTVSTQYGCSMGCSFCDVPKVGPGINASWQDITGQLEACADTHPDINLDSCERINVHFARMGEPTWNPQVNFVAGGLVEGFDPKKLHPVVSTMMPRRNDDLIDFLDDFIYIKNEMYDGNAGLQLSINSTSDAQREAMFNGHSLTLEQISRVMKSLPAPKGRKYTLNFAVAGYEIDGMKLRRWFSPDNFIVKLTPMHKTRAALDAGLKTAGDYTESYPYEAAEASVKNAGFDVLVFIASAEEDNSRITCGNAILADGGTDVRGHQRR